MVGNGREWRERWNGGNGENGAFLGWWEWCEVARSDAWQWGTVSKGDSCGISNNGGNEWWKLRREMVEMMG